MGRRSAHEPDHTALYPTSVQDNIVAGAKTAFLQGDQWAYLAGIVAVVLGAVLVWLKFPRRDEERRLLAAYQAEEAAESAPTPEVAPDPHPAT